MLLTWSSEGKGTLFNPISTRNLFRRSAFMKIHGNVLGEILHNFLMFFFLSTKCRSVTYIFIKQVRSFLRIRGQEVCWCSNKKCVTLMPRSVSWTAISRDSQHDLGTCHRNMTSRHVIGTWPSDMTTVHDGGTWERSMASDHDLRTWTRNMNWKPRRCACFRSLVFLTCTSLLYLYCTSLSFHSFIFLGQHNVTIILQ